MTKMIPQKTKFLVIGLNESASGGHLRLHTHGIGKEKAFLTKLN
jgi:hypothetical protein